jgi:hypothetical protein
MMTADLSDCRLDRHSQPESGGIRSLSERIVPDFGLVGVRR